MEDLSHTTVLREDSKLPWWSLVIVKLPCPAHLGDTKKLATTRLLVCGKVASYGHDRMIHAVSSGYRSNKKQSICLTDKILGEVAEAHHIGHKMETSR